MHIRIGVRIIMANYDNCKGIILVLLGVAISNNYHILTKITLWCPLMHSKQGSSTTGKEKDKPSSAFCY